MPKYFVHKADYVCTDQSKWEQDAVKVIELPVGCDDGNAIYEFCKLGYNDKEYSLADEAGFQILPYMQ